MESTSKTRVYIIGAGFAGREIASEIAKKGSLGRVVAFLDDDPEKIGATFQNIPVLGPISSVINLLRQTPADEAIIAMPSVGRDRLKKIYRMLKQADFSRIRILPAISQIIEGDAHLIQTREIDPQDLLGRNPVAINLRKSLSYIRGKRVLITGAGGSIGSELSRQLLSGGAERLYLFGHGENSIYELDRELRILQEEGVGEKATIVPVVGELQDQAYVDFLLSRLRADIIFHCAAHKHVPLLENNPVEAIKNNVFATRNLVRAADRADIKRFVLISTDKAVEPNCMYGASKLLAEEIVLNKQTKQNHFIVVRFGNVLGSRGSIVPLFTKQIRKGGPVTVTHPKAERYFMTVPEAASLVLQGAGAGTGGNLYLLDMGDPLCITDLAKQMIRFYGYEPKRDISIEYIGLRPGEKLTERLWAPWESRHKTEFNRIFRLKRDKAPLNGSMEGLMKELEHVCFFTKGYEGYFRNRQKLRKILQEYIPTIEVPDNEPEY